MVNLNFVFSFRECRGNLGRTWFYLSYFTLYQWLNSLYKNTSSMMFKIILKIDNFQRTSRNVKMLEVTRTWWVFNLYIIIILSMVRDIRGKVNVIIYKILFVFPEKHFCNNFQIWGYWMSNTITVSSCRHTRRCVLGLHIVLYAFAA